MKEREEFLDKLRVLATCAVIMLHTMTGAIDSMDISLYPEEKRVFLTGMDLVCWSVPVFLMISGYLFLNPGRQIGMGRMLTKYCRRIALALILFGVPYGCLELVMAEGGFRFGMLGEAFLMVLRGESWSHMWYLYLILLLYAATPLLKRVLRIVPRWTVYIAILALFLGCSVLPYLYELFGWEEGFLLPGDGIYFFYYICGYLFAASWKDGIPWKGRLNRTGRTVILAGLAFLVAAGMAASRLWGDYDLQMAYNYPFTVLLALLLFAWGKSAEREPHETKKRSACLFWQQAAALSFTIYLIHPVFLNLAYKFFHITPLSYLTQASYLEWLPFGLWLSLPLFFLCTLFLSAALAWLLYQISPLRKYVL